MAKIEPQVLANQAMHGYLDAELRARYLNHLAYRHRTASLVLSSILTILGSTAVANFALFDLKYLSLGLGLLTAILAAISGTLALAAKQHQENLGLASKWARRSSEWRGMWQDYLAGYPMTIHDIKAQRKLDLPLAEKDGMYLRTGRLISKFQQQIARAEGLVLK